MSLNESKRILKNRKPRVNAKTSSVEAEDDKKTKVGNKIDTKDIRNLPVSLQRGKSNHKWLAMMTVLGALLLKLLNEYNNRMKNKDTFYTHNVDAFLQYSKNNTFLTHLDGHYKEYPFELYPENITFMGSEYIKYDVEEAFLYTWEEYYFNNANVDKIDYIVEALDTKLLMFNNTQSNNHRVKLEYLIQQDLAIIKYAKEFGISPSVLGGLLSSYNLFENETLLKKSFPDGATILNEQILVIRNNLHSKDLQENDDLDIQFLNEHIVSASGVDAKNRSVKHQDLSSKELNINDIYLKSKEYHYDNSIVNISHFWQSVYDIKINNTKSVNSTIQLRKKTKVKKSNPLNKLRYIDISTQDDAVDVSYCKLPSSLLTVLTKGYDETEISKNKNLFDDVPDMKDNYGYAMELVRSCYHIFMESKVPLNKGGVPDRIIFMDAALSGTDFDGLILSKYGSFYFKPSTVDILKNDDILESIYYAFYASKSKTFHLWIFEIFQHYASLLDECQYDKLWFSHTLKYLYLSFLNDKEGIDHKRVVLTKNGHLYPTTI
ncbi:uncharacterized protein HGUI_02673 [Hanseniaspora guilliermondii]|uniref:Uncharacterized protein n=1 Tax=Hanseniaspora guilliermondii TaxID=56406 RepID=A0A1L0CPT9_9ASCO|nr:uncharacterized protein HGUI_02673 [Hanseniaspora guilliermondii]